MDDYDRDAATVASLKMWTNIIVVVLCLLACVPAVGLLTWVVGAPLCIVVMVFGVLFMNKGAVGTGVGTLMVGLVGLPVWLVVAPMVSMNLFSRWMDAAAGRVEGSRSSNSPEEQVKNWMSRSLADRDAELMDCTAPQDLWGKRYVLAKIRAKNAFGGPIVAEFVLMVMPNDGSVIFSYKPKDFVDLKVFEIQDGNFPDSESRLAQLTALCADWDIDAPK